MNITKFTDLVGNDAVLNQYGNLPTNLVASLGSTIRVSCVLGVGNETEMNRKLVGVDFLPTVHGLSIYLEMIEGDKAVNLILPNIQSASFDHGYTGRDGMSKYYLEIRNSLLDEHFSETDHSKRDSKYFETLGREERELHSLTRVTARVFLGDTTKDSGFYQQRHLGRE